MSELSFTESTPVHSIEEFKQGVREWLLIEDDLKNMQKVIREKRKRMQRLSEFISVYMKKNDKEICDVGNDQALVLKTRKSTGALKKEYVIKVLRELVSNDDLAKEYTERMYGMRPIKETSVLKKTLI
jgi:aminoglycoside N3'-acetyltransferase